LKDSFAKRPLLPFCATSFFDDCAMVEVQTDGRKMRCPLWSSADICSARWQVRFTPNSDCESGLSRRVMSALPQTADMCGAPPRSQYYEANLYRSHALRRCVVVAHRTDGAKRSLYHR